MESGRVQSDDDPVVPCITCGKPCRGGTCSACFEPPGRVPSRGLRDDARAVLAAEFHSGEPCDCGGPPWDDCQKWAKNILTALRRAGIGLRGTDV
jgi:hypothetical protein